MSRMVKVSIIIPIYNVEKYIDDCLSSLVNQSLKDIEIIAVDDGSTDSSGKILDKYAKKHTNIIAIHQPNQGISASRNRGLDIARGEYIGFIDSDDFADTTMFEKMYSCAKDNNLDIAVCDYYKKYNDGSLKEEKTINFDIGNINNNPLLFTNINMAIWNKIFKRNLFNNIRFSKIKYEDFAIVPQLLMNSKRIGKLNEYLVYYNIHSNGETAIVDKRVFDIFTILDGINKSFKKHKLLDTNYSEIEYFNIERIIMYSIQQRVQHDKNLINEFINKSYEYLDTNFPNWRNNKYFNERNILKLIIEKNKTITKIYCNIYRRIKGVRYEKTR